MKLENAIDYVTLRFGNREIMRMCLGGQSGRPRFRRESCQMSPRLSDESPPPGGHRRGQSIAPRQG